MAEATAWDGERHLQLLTTFHWVFAGIFGLVWLFTNYVVGVEFAYIGFAWLPVIALHAVAAMGLQQREGWGRIVSLIAAILSLFSFPLGTAFGVYAIVVHVRPDVKSILQGEPA